MTPSTLFLYEKIATACGRLCIAQHFELQYSFPSLIKGFLGSDAQLFEAVPERAGIDGQQFRRAALSVNFAAAHL